MVRWGRVDGAGRDKTGFTAFLPPLDARALAQGRELAKINILAVALALLRERRSVRTLVADLQ